MSFFPPEPEPAPSSEPEMVDRWDPANGNFPGYLGVPVSMDVEPIRTERLAITLDRFRGFPGGFKAELIAIARPGHTLDERGMHPDRTMGPGRLRIGLQFSDGRRGYSTRDIAPQGAFAIRYRGGGGSPFQFRTRLWIHAVPSPGPMDLVVAWADEDLPETRLSIPTEGIIDAVSRVAPVWGE
jgi:hypothetical protein